eukprot:2017353-Lingulodinium_polyedra.AAC.1
MARACVAHYAALKRRIARSTASLRNGRKTARTRARHAPTTNWCEPGARVLAALRRAARRLGAARVLLGSCLRAALGGAWVPLGRCCL